MEQVEVDIWVVAQALARGLDARSFWTAGHCERVAKISYELGRKMGYKLAQRERLMIAALLHDIGKLGVADEILDRPRKLTTEERVPIEEHPLWGVSILGDVGEAINILPAIMYHHKWYDGRGYPENPKVNKEDIPIDARIIAVADVYDALTGRRPYRRPLDRKEAITEISQNSEGQFDPKVVEAFLEVLKEQPEF